MPSRATGESFASLVWTLTALALATAPHVPHLPAWAVLLALAAGAWRLLAERRRWKFPARGIRFPLALAVFVMVLVSYRTINGVEAGSALLTVMMAMKLLETRTARDQRVLLFIACFMIMAGFLYGQSLWMLPYTAFTIWITTAGLLQAARAANPLPARRALSLSGRLLVQALPVMLVLFLLFPRVPGPFWMLPAEDNTAASGLSDEMTPGSIADLTLSDEVAFRVKFDAAIPPPSRRYWRGPVLHEYATGTWRVAPALGTGAATVTGLGTPYRYRVTLEPHGRRWLFALEMPQAWEPGAARQTFDYQLVSPEPVRRLFAYDVSSTVEYRTGQQLDSRLEAYELRLPPGENPRTRALARRLRASSANKMDYARRVLDHFRSEGFVYTLEPALLAADPLDQFLFETREGFCGHYASAFTFMMRTAGIPARVVTGYLGGELNPLGDYYIVRQSDAHAWSEIWLAGRGWMRIDPTAAVAPGRLQDSAARALRGTAARGVLSNNALFRGLRQIGDALDNEWKQWVVGYDSRAQNDLLQRMGITEPDWRKLTLALAVLLAAFVAGLSVYLAREFRPHDRDPVGQLYARFCHKLARRDLARGPAEGPVDFSRRVARARPELADPAGRITRLYVRLRYESAGTPRDVQALRRLIAGFDAGRRR